MGPAALYLDLLKRCLTNWIYPEAELRAVSPEGLLRPEGVRRLAENRLTVVAGSGFDPKKRVEGRDWPPFAHSMVGRLRLDALQKCVEEVIALGVPGDLMETGAWRGGATILMRGVLKAHGVLDRRVWVADSFAGMPVPDPERFPADRELDLRGFPILTVSVDQVRANFGRYGLLDDQVRFLPGWFRDTLPAAPVGALAVLRLDGDLYESTHEALVHLYPKLSPGGYLIVDDYLDIPACRQAVDDYRREMGIEEPIVAVDWTGVYWRRAGGPTAAAAEPAAAEPAAPPPEGPTADDWLRKGNAQLASGSWPEAAECYRRALSIRPDFAEAASQLGLALHDQGRLHEAANAYQSALRINPAEAGVHVRVGNLMQDMERPDQAIASYQQSIAIRPDAFAHANLAQLLANQGRIASAAEHFDASFRLRPDPKARVVRETLLPPVYDSGEDLVAWRQRLRDGIARLHADGVRIDTTNEIVPALFFLAYQGGNDRDIQRDYARLFTPPRPTRPVTRKPGGKVRVGFLSRHFNNHTIGSLNRGVVAQLSREHLHVSVLSVGISDDQTARDFQEHADHYVVLPQHLPSARKAVAEMGLDILYYADIGMAPFTYSLAFSRLAPVQCVTWGHPLTTGVPDVDYFVSSELAEPEGADAHYTEKLVRLKGLQTYYHRPRPGSTPKGREHFGLPHDANLYGCPQTLFKFHPEFDAALAAILRADPRGLLVLVEGRHRHWNELLLGRWGRTMPDVAHRVRFLPKLSRDDFLHLTALFDVALDPFHFGGGNTTLEALALGTPVVTLPSGFLRGRLTDAQYRLMGITDCVTSSPEEYVETAVRFGSDRAERHEVSGRILEACPVLFENPLGVRALEEFFLEVARPKRLAPAGVPS